MLQPFIGTYCAKKDSTIKNAISRLQNLFIFVCAISVNK